MVIYPESFNIKPDSEVTVNFSNLLNTASENAKPKSLLLQKGNYVFLSKYALERELYITNTIADKEYSETDKKHIHKIALDLKGINDLEIDFNNSTIILHTKRGCVHNLFFLYPFPTRFSYPLPASPYSPYLRERAINH